ncbi:division/cell wall cluster transcriptional repressor MraZ [Candidatus Falkowbacteria bacterium]|jgi:MraZ protein|nr:MAG: division/cell wall cluster transcriptional repressor MraZ [Candidatus Falkowbacteria bacterium]
MFIGEYNHTIDEKGRIAVPSKFRQLLRGGAVVTRGLDNCLVVYTKKEWGKLAEKIASLPFNKANDRSLSRFILAGAMEVDFDGQGRVTLPEYLRDFAKLTKKAVVAGLYNRLEIWNEEAWNTFKATTEKQSNQIAEALGEIN